MGKRGEVGGFFTSVEFLHTGAVQLTPLLLNTPLNQLYAHSSFV